ncbi:MAG: GNAT family N-acetyltransferase, partial [Planctomycetota bacterium]
MPKVFTVAEDSPELKQVMQLWRANSDYLGFFPDGAFEERARKGQVCAIKLGSDVAAYAIYYVDRRDRIRLTHLCVSENARGLGYSRELLTYLQDHNVRATGISLRCRRDYPAWPMWPKLGFTAVKEEEGRGDDGGTLTTFWMEFGRASLFGSDSELDEDRLTVAIDSNVFFDLADRSRNGAEESWGLTADWIADDIQLAVTDELFNEIQRNPNEDERKVRMTAAKTYSQLTCGVTEFQKSLEAVRRLLPKATTENGESDQRHLARAIASDAQCFVTRDDGLWKVGKQVYAEFGLLVLRPAELIGQFEEVRNERAYQHARLAG